MSDRIRGMIWGQFVGDAAALGSHWIYDLEKMRAAFPEGLRGFEEPAPDHYHKGKRAGDQTHYGDAALLLLESMAETGAYVASEFAGRFLRHFTSEACRSYKDYSTRETLQHLQEAPENFLNGADDDQPATVTRLAPLVALYGPAPEKVAALTRFSQNNDRAVVYAEAHASLLGALLEGVALDDALALVTVGEPAASIAQAIALQEESVTEATLKLGQKCPLSMTFPAAIHAARKNGDDFAAAIRATLAAGGDNAARASMVGAWLGAALGEGGVPFEWRERLTAAGPIAADIERLLILRSRA